MGFAGRHIGLIAALSGIGALSVDRGMDVRVQNAPSYPEPTEPRRAPAPSGGRTYKEKGKRQAARHLRQMERIAARRARHE